MRGNITKADLTRGSGCTTSPLYQYDYGQVLQLLGVELPEAYEVHFANSPRGEAKTSIGGADGVVIPDEYLLTGGNVYAWLFLHTGEDDGETEYRITIPVIARAKPTDAEPTPVQQDVITQAIAALNVAVTETAASAEAAAGSAELAEGEAELAAASAAQAEAAQEAAEAAETAAQTYAGNAATSAANAANSASQAATSAGNASTSAGQAQTSAGAAAQSAADAAASESGVAASAAAAAGSATNAAASASGAAASKAAADSAKGAAQAAQTAAEAAQTAAEAAQTAAESAQTAAAGSATAAAGSATAAAGSATAAAGSATSAAASASEAEDARDTITGMTVSAETLAAGTPAEVEWADGNLAFGIPQGPQGLKGDKGDKGEPGGAYIQDRATGDPYRSLSGCAAEAFVSCVARIDPIQDGTGDPSASNIRPLHGLTAFTLVRGGENMTSETLPTVISNTITFGSADTTMQAWSTGTVRIRVYKVPKHARIKVYKVTTSYIGHFAFGDTPTPVVGTPIYDYFSIANSSHGPAVVDTGDHAYLYNRSSMTGTGQRLYIAYENDELIADTDGYAEYPVDLSSIGTVYGGTFDALTGVLTVTHDYIASYAGETLPGVWISDRDVYAAGTTPTTGAQVVYELETPTTHQLTAITTQTLEGITNFYSTSGAVAVTYIREILPYFDDHFAVIRAIIAPTEASTTASKAYEVNEFFILGDTLYKVTAPIASGSRITVNTNCTATTIAEQITAILNA